MAEIIRGASAQWNGTLKEGNGQLSTDSGVLKGIEYTFATRFENQPGTNPEELIGAAHAACYSMAFGNTLGGKGYKVNHIKTHAAVTLSGPQPGGRRVLKIVLTTRGNVEGIDNDTFKAIALEAEQGCPISNALRAVPIEVDAALE
jgi:osmotically inducible protein OsmC